MKGRPVLFLVSLIFALYIGFCSSLHSQSGVTVITTNDTINRKFSLHSENNQIIDARVSPPIQYLNGNVKVFHAGTFMFCDTAVIRGSILKMKHNVAMLQNDTIRLFADSMVYHADFFIAHLYGDIILENGRKKLYTHDLKYHVNTKIATYENNGLLVQDSTQLVSKKGSYFMNEKRANFQEKVIVTGTDFKMYSDSLNFESETQIARFIAPTRIKRDTVEIYAESGWFDLDDKMGDFIQNAQYLSGTTIALADTIHYDGQRDIVILSSGFGTSQYISSVDTAFAKKIVYDRKRDLYKLKGSAYYQSKANKVVGDYVEYDKKNEKFKTLGRGTVSDPPMIITADTLDYDKSRKFGIADGKVIWQDTSAKTTIYSDHVRYRGNENFMLAYNEPGVRPYFTTQIDTSLMHLKADTLKSLQVINVIDSTRIDTIDYFIGFNNVRIYKEDMQMVCDSLVYNLTDSVFTLYSQPVLWSDTTQISGDTMHFYMKNKAMDRLVIKENGAIISSEDLQYYDQVKGKFIEAYFDQGKMKRMKVDGDAEVIYYMKDSEKAYIGVNQSKSSYITFRLENNQISDILFYIDVKSKVLPMTTNHESLKIKGFKWETKIRPTGIDDL